MKKACFLFSTSSKKKGKKKKKPKPHTGTYIEKCQHRPANQLVDNQNEPL
jgi:hypothetical protein